MGFSTSAATVILFIGLFVAIGIAFPAFETAYDRQTEAFDDREDRALDVRNTAIEANASYNETADELTVNATNVGSTTISVEDMDLLVDGAYVVESNYTTVVGSDGTERSLVQPGERVQLTVSNVTEPPDRVKVVTGLGVAETITEVPVYA
ncbi:flagellin [Halovivax limisalsi]|uniref:flagellin n=1 Tax=Halovivax limisalsi TaxID=1453760 RepID=UPI001FFCA7E1|nr:flagellin [Halovivax limisalsi]